MGVRLYHRFPRLRYRRLCNRVARERIQWALSLRVGDLINDCTSFNVEVREILPVRYRSKRGWAIVDVDFVASVGSCSLRNCGVEPPLTREAAEKRWLDLWGEDWGRWFFQDYDTSPDAAQHREWLSTLQGGGHILDERGVLLPEFRAR